MACEELEAFEIRIYRGPGTGAATTIIGFNSVLDSPPNAAVCAFVVGLGRSVTKLSAAEFFGNANFDSMDYLEVDPPLENPDLQALGRFLLDNTSNDCTIDVIDHRSQPPWLERPPQIIAQRRREAEVCVELLGA